MTDWISVKDRLPDDGSEVLIVNPTDKNRVSIAYIRNSLFFDLIDFTMNPLDVFYWMPLPLLPAREDDK